MSDTYREFVTTFNSIAHHKHRYDVFRDFVTASAISLHNSITPVESLENEYLGIVGGYDQADVDLFPILFAQLVGLLEEEPRDVLGTLYLELELGSAHVGQFFTPPEVSQLMAQMGLGDTFKGFSQPFITVSEPACGAGGMVLAVVKMMIAEGLNPAEKLWVQCIDADRLAALMCYIQLSLWNVPAEVLVGNTLTMSFREQFLTPAHRINGWEEKLRTQRAVEKMKMLMGAGENRVAASDTAIPASVSASAEAVQASKHSSTDQQTTIWSLLGDGECDVTLKRK